MADETQKQLEVTISQPTPEAVSQAGRSNNHSGT
jgi:hypothetical protein